MTLDKDALESLKLDRESDDAQQAQRARPVLLVTLGVLLVLAAVITWALWPTTVAVHVITVTVAQQDAAGSAGPQRVLNASGYVVARRQATVSSKITGKVSEVLVEEGMRVKADQVVARLEADNANAELAVAKSQAAAAETRVTEIRVRLDQARRDLQRTRALQVQGLVSQAALDTASADFDATQASLATAKQELEVAENNAALSKQHLDDTVIRAPFAGVIISKDAQPGEIVSPMSAGGGFTRTGICTVVDMSSLEIEVDVNESYIQRVHDGQQVQAVLDAYPDWNIPAHVLSIVPAADRQKATVKVRIAFDQLDPRILPDMAVQVWFMQDAGTEEARTGGDRALTVPGSVVREESGKTVVYIVDDDGDLERRAVAVTAQPDGAMRVTAGLHEGDRLVADPDLALHDGMHVKIIGD